MADATSSFRSTGHSGGGAGAAPTHNLVVEGAAGAGLDVRSFHVTDRMSGLFEARIVAVSPDPDLDFEAVVGQPMGFTIHGRQRRSFSGVCSDLRQIAVEERGLSTYELTLVPELWLCTQRRNYRIFQQMSEIDIALKVLGEWGISPALKLSGAFKKRKYRVQYGESDYSFVSRMLEDAGVSSYRDEEGGLVLDDGPHANAARAPIPFRMNPTVADREHVTAVRVGRRLRPGKYTVRDHDPRRPPGFPLAGAATGGAGVEGRLERFHYVPGAFVVESDKGESTPFADDKGKYRADEGEGAAMAKRRLEAKRAGARTITFETNALDLGPGTVVSFLDHPKRDLGPGSRLLVVESTLSGTALGEWTHACAAVSADAPYRPPLRARKPRVTGVESATVVGPPGEEIHVDEFGRVRVHFHWDREGRMDDSASCWIPVSQPWGGAGYGGTNLPRVGQEVIVDFLGGDPDRPIITGRVYTGVQRTPYKLPEHKTKTVWRSQSTGGGGHNEIMFEDARGQELLYFRAERDLERVVKRDEIADIARDHGVAVVRDERRKVGRDRTIEVGGDQSLSVGGDNDRRVGGDESILIGGDQSITIARDRSILIGGERTERVARDADLLVGGDLSKNVARNERETTGQSRSITVGQRRTAEIGTIDAISVGKEFCVRVSPPQGEEAKGGEGGEGGEEPTTLTMTHQKIVFSTGAGATITMEGAVVRIDADEIKLYAKKWVGIDAEEEYVGIHAKTDISLVSDQKVYVWAKDGPLNLTARGGWLNLESDQGIMAQSKEIQAHAESGLFLRGAKTATLYGGEETLVSSGKSTTVEAIEAVDVRAIVIRTEAEKSTRIRTSAGMVLVEGRTIALN